MSNFALPVDGVIAINRQMTGSRHAILDLGKLENALAAPLAGFGGYYKHQTVLQRGAALLEGLARAHAFQDGNKRTAWTACNTYLSLWGSPLREVPPKIATDFVVDVVVYRHDNATISAWLVEQLA
ncbi:Fic family protein [Nocardia higoensis]|uniref:Fic family protein n=1 Tax=Nocardia higoensis TaxID=228599 RepID=A0ABS0DIB5_9NOCA|nr:Fic family protein [Nocardia higoensis]MBF6358208.1 Fic family protein [Nocardia higoensis]